MRVIGAILDSEEFIIGWTAKCLGTVIVLIGYGIMIDFTQFALPDEKFLPVMLIAAILGGFFFVRLTYLNWYRRFSDGEDQDPYYKASQIICMVLAIGIGLFASTPVINAIGTGAGMWTYALGAFILAGVFGYVLLFICNKGIKEFILEHASKAKEISTAVVEAQETVAEISETIKPKL